MSEGMEQINRLMERVARLYQEGRYQQAFAVAQQACDLTRREVGARHPLFAASPNNLALLYHDMGDLAAAPGTILALDLGKYKSVACLYDLGTARAAFASVATSRGSCSDSSTGTGSPRPHPEPHPRPAGRPGLVGGRRGHG
jgi:hypothetical protein